MYEAQFDSIRYGEMKKYFPGALSFFEKMIKEMPNEKAMFRCL